MARIRQLGLNSISFMYAQGISILLQFVQIPIFLKFWGKDLYGEWLVVTGLANTLVLLDIGVARASESRAIALAASGNWILVRRSIHTAQAFTLTGIAILSLGACTLPLFNWVRLFGLTLIPQSDALSILICLIGCVAVSLQMGVIDARFKIAGRTPLGTFIIANRRLLTLAVCSISLYLGVSAPRVAFCTLVSDLIFLCLSEIVCRRVSRENLSGFRQSSIDEFKSIFSPSISYLGFPLAQAITLQGGVQLLNHFAGSREVVNFTMVRTLVRVILQLGTVINNSLKPEISRYSGLGDFGAIRKLRQKSMLLAGMLGACGVVGLLITGPAIIARWSHGQVNVDRKLICLVSSHAILNLLWMVPAAVDMGLNKHGYLGRILVISSLLCFGGWMAGGNEISPVVGYSLLLAIPEFIAVIATYMRCRQVNSDIP